MIKRVIYFCDDCPHFNHGSLYCKSLKKTVRKRMDEEAIVPAPTEIPHWCKLEEERKKSNFRLIG